MDRLVVRGGVLKNEGPVQHEQATNTPKTTSQLRKTAALKAGFVHHLSSVYGLYIISTDNVLMVGGGHSGGHSEAVRGAQM